MGWDTYLHLGAVTESWRKHAPPTAALLFSSTAYETKGDVHGERDGKGVDAPEFISRFVAPALACRERLAELGYDWQFLLATYADARWNGFAAGAYLGSLDRADGTVAEGAAAAYTAFKTSEPSGDISAYVDKLRGLLAAGASSTEDLPGGADDQDMFSLFNEPNTSRGVELFRAMRATEFLLWLRHQAPHFGWLFFIRLLLEALPDEGAVEFDVTEHVQELVGAGEVESAVDFPAHFLQRSLEDLSREAQLIGRLYGALAAAPKKLGLHYWAGRAAALLTRALSDAETPQERGRLLEEVVAAVVQMDPELGVIERNLSNEAEEIDLVLANRLPDPFWQAFNSPVLFVECKNWKARVGAEEARIFESKVRERGSLCRVGIFVAVHGFTEPFMTLLRRLQPQGTTMFVITGDDLRAIVAKRQPLSQWLSGPGLQTILRAG